MCAFFAVPGKVFDADASEAKFFDADASEAKFLL